MLLYTFALAFVTAFGVTYFVIPSVIRIATEKGLTDEPGHRRSHTVSTPSLGGLGISAGVFFSVIAWTPHQLFASMQYVLCACIIVTLIGAKDDIIPTRPWVKLVGQLFAAVILVVAAEVQIPSLFGIFGVGELSLLTRSALTIFTVTAIVNAFNLIDGVNGLTGAITIVTAGALGTFFFLVGKPEFAILSSALIGSCFAFLKFNWTPARIFMGDTGSLLLGLLLSVLTVEFLEAQVNLPKDSPYYLPAAPAAAIGLLIVPLFDMARVFATRVYLGRSPLHPDRNHIQHILVDLGLTHVQTAVFLAALSLGFAVLAVLLQDMGNLLLIITLSVLAGLGTTLLYLQLVRRRRALIREGKLLDDKLTRERARVS